MRGQHARPGREANQNSAPAVFVPGPVQNLVLKNVTVNGRAFNLPAPAAQP